MRNIRFWGGIGLVVMLAAGVLLAAPGSKVLAQESLTPGTTVEGTINSDDGVTYSLAANTGQLIMISMESDDFDAVLSIADADGNELFTDNNSGEGDNALLVMVAQTDATYIVTAKPSWSSSGAFTLTANLSDPAIIDLDGTATLTPDADAEIVYGIFAAPANTVVDVWATTQGDENVSVELFGVDAQSIEHDNADGPGYNALLRRVVLPAEGLYLVKAEANWGDTPLTAPVDVKVDVTEQLFITAEPYAVSLSDDDLGTEVFTFEAVNGTVYRITATCALGTGVHMTLFDTNAAALAPYFETFKAVKAVWEYQSDVDGLVRIDVHLSFLSDGDDFTFMIETVG